MVKTGVIYFILRKKTLLTLRKRYLGKGASILGVILGLESKKPNTNCQNNCKKHLLGPPYRSYCSKSKVIRNQNLLNWLCLNFKFNFLKKPCIVSMGIKAEHFTKFQDKKDFFFDLTIQTLGPNILWVSFSWFLVYCIFHK